MAFVYRSPRNLEYTCQHRYQYQQQLQNENNEPRINRSQQKRQRKKQPVKGLSLKKRQKQQQHNNDITDKNTQIIPNIHSGQAIIYLNKKNNNSSQEQYFFKSKCNRRVINDQLKQNQQTKIKEIMQKQFFKKITQQKPKNQMYIEEKKPTKIKKAYQVQQNFQNYKKLPCLMSKQAKNSGVTMSLVHSKKLRNKIFAVPSIPGKFQKFGYVFKQKQLSYPKNVSKPRFQGQKYDLPGPADYQISQRKKIKGVLKFRSLKNEFNKSSNDFFALIDDQETLKKHNQKIKEWVKQGKLNKKKKKFLIKLKERDNLQTRDMSIDSEDSGITIYDDDVTPGPGYYKFPPPGLKNSFRSNNQKFSKIFFSQAQRFDDFKLQKSSTPFCSSLHLEDQPQTKHLLKRNKFFISKLQRSTNIQNQSDAPSPGYYDVRTSMQNDIINRILRNSPNLFNNKLPRLVDPVSSIAPGPGYYDLSLPQFKVESFKPQFQIQQIKVKKQKQCLKQSQKILIQCSKQVKKTHQRKDNVIQKQNKAPFLTSSPKNLSLHNSSLTDYHTSLPMENSIKQKLKQNLYAFNSSAERSNPLERKPETEIGLYDMSNYAEWDRKSYNVLFN